MRLRDGGNARVSPGSEVLVNPAFENFIKAVNGSQLIGNPAYLTVTMTEAELRDALEAISNLLYLIRISVGNDPLWALYYLRLAEKVSYSIDPGPRR
jgi:hypothetical protein